MAELPLGYRFNPSKTELIGHFLKAKLNGEALPSHYPLFEFNVYSDHPFNILASKKNEDGIMEGYVFTPLKKTTEKGKRVSRVIEGHGTWAGKSKVKDVYDKAMTEVIGFERYYKFEPIENRKNEPENEYEWKMHEYTDLGNNIEKVLCHITNKPDPKDDGGGCRASKRVRYYDIMGTNCEASTSKRNRVEHGSLECNSSTVNPTQQYTTIQGFQECSSSSIINPTQQYTTVQGIQDKQYNTTSCGYQGPQYNTMPLGVQEQQYSMSYRDDFNQGQHQTMPLGLQDQPLTMLQGFQDQRYYTAPLDFHNQQFIMPQGDLLGHHQQNTMLQGSAYELEETINQEALVSEPHMVEQGTECSNKQGITSLNDSSAVCTEDSMQAVPQEDVGHDDEETNSDQEFVDELESELMSNDESDDMQVPQDDEETNSDQEFVDELEFTLMTDDEGDDGNKALGDKLVYNDEQVQQEDNEIYDNLEPITDITINDAQDYGTRFDFSSTRYDLYQQAWIRA